MLNLQELSKQISDYRSGTLSLADFTDWFRDSSLGTYASKVETSEVAASVEAALSRFQFESNDESELKQDLANAILPFDSGETREERLDEFGNASRSGAFALLVDSR